MIDGLECKFRCACGEGSFAVRYRNDGEDIVFWMETVVRPAMGAAHMKKSPICRASSCDLMLPLSEGSTGIGISVRH